MSHTELYRPLPLPNEAFTPLPDGTEQLPGTPLATVLYRCGEAFEPFIGFARNLGKIEAEEAAYRIVFALAGHNPDSWSAIALRPVMISWAKEATDRQIAHREENPAITFPNSLLNNPNGHQALARGIQHLLDYSHLGLAEKNNVKLVWPTEKLINAVYGHANGNVAL